MSDEHVGPRLVAYLARELPEAERAVVEAHLAECAECREEAEHARLAWTAVSGWARDPALPMALEDRIVADLGTRGTQTLGKKKTWWRSSVAAAALAGVVCGLTGFGAGRLTSKPAGGSPVVAADSSLHSYMLLLEEPNWPPPQPLARNGYGAWSRALVAESKFVGAAKLSEEPGFRVTRNGEVARPSVGESNYSGWYIVRARNYDEAISWARRGPHLAYGSVLVREIE